MNMLEERKYVTAVFSDVSGYTKLFERLDAETVKEITSAIFAEISKIVEKYQGFIERVIGDEVFVMFGVPKTREDDPVRAVRAAMEFHAAAKAVSLEFESLIGHPLLLHSGINTGMVVTGETGPQKSLDGFAGQIINVASRLTSLAGPDQIVVGHETYRRSRYGFNYRELPPFVLDGRKEPVHRYELLSQKDYGHRPRLGSERSVRSDMVGREYELGSLKSLLKRAVNGDGSIVNIIGEAGIGKSRLIFELKRTDEMKQSILLEGGSIPIGWNLSFHPIVELLRNWAVIEGSDSEIDAFVKLETTIKTVCPENADEISVFVAVLMGIKPWGRYADRIRSVEGSALETLILRSIRTLIISATDISPLVIILEDLHWADASTIGLVEKLFSLVKNRRLLLINVFRPHYAETVDRVISTLHEHHSEHYTEINLAPLDKQQGEKIIHNLLEVNNFAHPVSEQILERAGGNPFFIEEVLRSLIDSGVLAKSHGSYRATENVGGVDIPQAIGDVLIARTDMLDDQARHFLRIASVIGRSFLQRIIIRLMKPEDELENVIGYLKDIELIVEHQKMGEREYLFKHVLTQEAIYNSMLLKQRRELHVQIARAIEEEFSERLHDFYGMLAYHYSNGGDLENSEKYMLKAGEEALKTSASSEALYYFQSAMDLYIQKYGRRADPQKIAHLKSNIAKAFFCKGLLTEAVASMDQVLELYGENAPIHSISRLMKFAKGFLIFLVSIYLPFLRWKKTPRDTDNEIMDLFHKKFTALSSVDPKRFFFETFYLARIITRFKLQEISYGGGIFASASITLSLSGMSFRLSRKTLDFMENKIKSDDVRSLLTYRLAKVMHYFLGEKLIEEKYDKNLLQENLDIGEFHVVGGYYMYSGIMRIELGNYDDCEESIHGLFQVGEIYDNKYSKVQKYRVKATLLMKFRKLEDAIQECQAGIKECTKKDYQQLVFLFHSYLARIHILLHNVKEAELSIQKASEIIGTVTMAPLFLDIFLIAQLAFHLHHMGTCIDGDDKRGFSIHRKPAGDAAIRVIKNSRKVASNRAEAYRLLGRYCWLLGEQKKALHWWGKSIGWCEQYGSRLELPRTFMEIGRSLNEHQSKYKTLNGAGPEKYLTDTGNMFEEMGLYWDLDQLRKLDS